MNNKFIVIGEYKECPAEGMQVITSSVVNTLRDEFSANVKVYTTWQFLLNIPNVIIFKPKRVVFTHGPGLGVIIISRLVALFTSAKIDWVASRPSLSNIPEILFKYTHVDNIIYGKHSDLLRRISDYTKAPMLKTIIGIDFSRLGNNKDGSDYYRRFFLKNSEILDVKILLHVGHIRQNRGLEKLISIKEFFNEKVEIVVVGSPALRMDSDVFLNLKEHGIQILVDYIEDMSAVYKAADFYLFTVDPDGGAVDLPLSVIEAIASKVPVISTPFGILPDVLSGVDGITFVSQKKFSDEAIETISDWNADKESLSFDLPKEFDLKSLARLIYKLD